MRVLRDRQSFCTLVIARGAHVSDVIAYPNKLMSRQRIEIPRLRLLRLLRLLLFLCVTSSL